MRLRLLIVVAVLAISQPAFAMEREHPGYSIDPLSTTIVITAATATAFYNAYYPQTPHTGEVLLVVDEEQSLRTLMTALCKKLALYYGKIPTSSSSDPAWLLTMGGIVDRSCHTAVTAAANAVYEAFRDARVEGYAPWDASGDIARGAALNTAREAAFNTVKGAAWAHARGAAWNAAWRAGHNARYNVGRDAAYNAALEALAPGATLEIIEQAAYRAAEGAILSWLLANIEMVMEEVYPLVLEALDNNPFASNDASASFMKERLGSLNEEAMLFLAPWLVLIVPINAVPEIHRRLFIDLRMILVWPQASQLLLAETDASSVLHIFPHDIFGFIRSHVITVLFFQNHPLQYGNQMLINPSL